MVFANDSDTSGLSSIKAGASPRLRHPSPNGREAGDEGFCHDILQSSNSYLNLALGAAGETPKPLRDFLLQRRFSPDLREGNPRNFAV